MDGAIIGSARDERSDRHGNEHGRDESAVSPDEFDYRHRLGDRPLSCSGEESACTDDSEHPYRLIRPNQCPQPTE